VAAAVVQGWAADAVVMATAMAAVIGRVGDRVRLGPVDRSVGHQSGQQYERERADSSHLSDSLV
jgi:hypothetical protein